MGIAEIRQAFQTALPDRYSCTSAKMRYGRQGEQEVQLLEFEGIGPADAFKIVSDPIPPNGNLLAAAAATAAKVTGD